LRAEHDRLRTVLVDVAGRAQSGDFRLCDEVWDAFAAGLEKHLLFEEAELFPRFENTSDEACAEVARLSGEHQSIRRSVFELGVALQTHTVQLDDVSALLSALESHASREDAMLYPWASATYGTQSPVCELSEA